MSHEVKRLKARHHQIIGLMLAGLTQSQIAERMEMTARGVRNIQGSPIFQDELARRRAIVERETDEHIALVPARARQIMEDHAADAARTIVNGLEDPDPRVRQASANSILDRMGKPYGFAGS